MNVVILIGNLAADPEVRETNNGKSVANLRVAVNKGKDEADFFDVVAWEKQAENVGKYLSKGSKIGVEGRLQTREWENNEGEKRRSVEVVAFRIHFLGDRGKGKPKSDVPGDPPEEPAAAKPDEVPF